MVKGINYNMVFISDHEYEINGDYGITPADVLNDAHPIIIRLLPSYSDNNELLACGYRLVIAVVKANDNYVLIDIEGGSPFATSTGYNVPFKQETI